MFVTGCGLDNKSPTAVLCPMLEDVSGEEHEEELVEDSEIEMILVLGRRVYDSETGVEILREKVLAGRKAETEEIANHHVFDEILGRPCCREELPPR